MVHEEKKDMENKRREPGFEAECKGSGIMVSVCCITYNQVSYIRDALEGFVNQQTDFAYEVLIHDDASSDGTAEIIREYAKRYPGPDLSDPANGKPVLKGTDQRQRNLQFSAGQRKVYCHV